MAGNVQEHLQMHYLKENWCILIEILPQESNWQYLTIALGNALAPNIR